MRLFKDLKICQWTDKPVCTNATFNKNSIKKDYIGNRYSEEILSDFF